MFNVGGSTSPWKNPCTSKLSDSELRDTMCTRWEEDNMARSVCIVAIYVTTYQHRMAFLPSFYVFCSSLILEEVERMSVCELEVDAVAADVLNRLEIESKGVCVCVCV